MTQLQNLQKEFGNALLNPDLSMPNGIIGPDGQPSAKRFSVYRNNVIASLVEALGNAFPVVRKLVGVDFFNAMAAVYVRQEPPKTPVLITYGDTFGNFLDQFEPAKSLPYLADIARLEHARLVAYHAADKASLDTDMLARIDPENLGNLKLSLHSATVLIRSDYSIVSLWRANEGDRVPGSIDVSRSENALITRPEMDVKLRAISTGYAIFLESIMEGSPLSSAAERALTLDASFDLETVLASLLDRGALLGICSPDIS
ncbi:MAG: DUF2063 domain-containing protein [Hyphomicrobiales bacterium]|nr:MAG: DUF2063 domain-containing protein [Hyphomicrobiales bacterium]